MSSSTPRRRYTVLRMSGEKSGRGAVTAVAVAAGALVTLVAAAAAACLGWLVTGWMRDLPDRVLNGQGDVVAAWPFIGIIYLVSFGTAAIGFWAVLRSVRMAFNGFVEMATVPLLGAAIVFAAAGFGPSVMTFAISG